MKSKSSKYIKRSAVKEFFNSAQTEHATMLNVEQHCCIAASHIREEIMLLHSIPPRAERPEKTGKFSAPS
jgi:hypothetical protein